MQQLDTIYLVGTPEGIDLQAELAGPIARALAYAIDLSIRSVVLMLISMFLLFGGNVGIGVMLLVSFLMEWFYPVFFEVYRNGQTPGKKMMGLAVVNDDLTAINLNSSVIRNLLRVADFFPFGYLGGLLSMVLTGKFQRLGDLAAGSVVIYKSELKQNVSLPECQSHPPPVSLSLEDQTAIIGFTERHQNLSVERQQELADILGDVINREPERRIEYLRGIGSWLLGVR